MKKPLLAIGLLAIPIFLYLSFREDSSSDNSFLDEIIKERKEKELFMKTSKASPFIDDLSSYEPLKYFEPNPAFRVNAKVKKFTEVLYVDIAESDGSNARYLKYARLSFIIHDTPMELVVLKPTGFGQVNVLFTAFADQTSGISTYGAGRYLDLDFKNATSIVLDFNKSYNPYCAYNENFSCPFPPRENVLPISIEAGEKVYKSL